MFYKVLKSLFIALITIAGGFSALAIYIFITEVSQLINSGREIRDLYLVLIPFSVLILSIPGLLFQVKTFTFFDSPTTQSDVLLDSSFGEPDKVKSRSQITGLFFWVCNFILGLAFIFYAGAFIYYLSDQPQQADMLKYSIGVAYVACGCMLVIDELVLSRLINKNKK